MIYSERLSLANKAARGLNKAIFTLNPHENSIEDQTNTYVAASAGAKEPAL